MEVNHLRIPVLKVQTAIMKTFTTILVLAIFTITSTFASTTPEVILSNEEMTIVDLSTQEFINTSAYNSATSNLEFETSEKIAVIQIFNEQGVLEFQLPVMSNNVKINKNLFGEGQYKLGFLIEGNTELQFTQVNIN